MIDLELEVKIVVSREAFMQDFILQSNGYWE